MTTYSTSGAARGTNPCRGATHTGRLRAGCRSCTGADPSLRGPRVRAPVAAGTRGQADPRSGVARAGPEHEAPRVRHGQRAPRRGERHRVTGPDVAFSPPLP